MSGNLTLLSRAADFGILYYYRHKVNPKQCDRIDALQLRTADSDLKPISFLFSCYAPHACFFEIFDSYRRIIMQGVLTFAGMNDWETGPAVVGILLALSTGIIVRELAPCASLRALFCLSLTRPRLGHRRESFDKHPRQHCTAAAAQHISRCIHAAD